MKLTKHVDFTGSMNPGMRIFDIIMRTEYGTSYNSYVVKGEKAAVIETVHADYYEEFLERIEDIVPIAELDYVVLNHTEPDHSGSLVKLLEKNPKIQVIGTAVAIRNLKNITNMEFESRTVKTGEQLDLGEGVVLDFIVSPNLHWPDSMFTYLKKDKVLFSCDVFGSHFCEPNVLDKYVKNPEILRGERWNYYNCIFSPFKRFVLNGLERIKDLEVEMICPSHGPVLVEYIKESMEDYRNWSEENENKFAAIFYVTAYGYTEKLANTFKEALEEAGVSVKMFNAIECDPGEMAAALNESKAVLFGSPTINRDALKPLWDVISCTEAMNVNKKPALSFGSYGWSGEAVKMLNNRLSDLGYDVEENGFRCVFSPTEEDLDNVKKMAKEFAAKLS